MSFSFFFPDLLHLSPKSHEAKIFEDFEETLEKNSTTPVPSGKHYLYSIEY